MARMTDTVAITRLEAKVLLGVFACGGDIAAIAKELDVPLDEVQAAWDSARSKINGLAPFSAR